MFVVTRAGCSHQQSKHMPGEVHFATVTVTFSVIYSILFGIAQSVCDSLRAGRSGDRIPVGARFSAAVQTGPGAHPASYAMGTGSLSRG